MNTLTGIEAERVSQILRHAIDRLHILSYVPTQWDDDLATGSCCYHAATIPVTVIIMCCYLRI